MPSLHLLLPAILCLNQLPVQPFPLFTSHLISLLVSAKYPPHCDVVLVADAGMVTIRIFCLALSEYDRGGEATASFSLQAAAGQDLQKAAKYILWKFIQEYPHVTQATNTKNICLVFATVKETILQHPLKDSWPDTRGWNGGREGRMDEPILKVHHFPNCRGVYGVGCEMAEL
ncbi:hypothetical protein C8J57DRAFT_1223070 [Mycena rebaudengoi]|nr:hypothetical protein C8J57DRAFT_1223070 [Mycena rebaudengoi]